MILSDIVGSKRLELWLVSDAVLKLAHRAEDTRTVGFLLTILKAHAEFDSEPIDRSKLLDVELARTERGKTDFLAEVREVLVSEHGRVTHQLVDDVGLRGVERLRVVPNVLGRVENLECKSVQELSLSQQTADRF